MFGKSQSIIIVFIDRNRLQFYGGGLSNILALDIPPTVVKDLEIMNRDNLYALVNQWLKQNNLGGARLCFVLSPQAYFEKVLTAASESEQETEILAFYDSVPFDELVTKIIVVDNKKRAIAANKDFVDGIRHAFMLQGLHVISVIPASLLGTLSTKRWLDAQTGAYILKHFDVLKTQSLLDAEEEQSPLTPPSASIPTTKNNPRLMIMVGILGVLLLALVFVVFTRH